MVRLKNGVRFALGGALISVAVLSSAGGLADADDRPALLAAASGADYELGYRDGLDNKAYRDKDRSNKAYGDGYKAGQERRRSSGGAQAGNADFQLGYRDGYDRQPYRDKDRSNKSYGEGFKSGQSDRERGVLPNQRPGTAAASGRPRSLVGHNADKLESEMQAIGYTWRAGTMKGRDSHTTWRGATDNQCVLAVSRQGKVVSVSDVAASNCR
jgi:hypothetical protein